MLHGKIKTMVLAVFAFLTMPLTLISCLNWEIRSTPIINPRQLLEGTRSDSTLYFDFYEIGNGEAYAVSLNDDYKLVDFENVDGSGSDYPEDRDCVGKIVIPTEHNGIPVTGIWNKAFHGNPTKEIVLKPSGTDPTITVIDYEAFLYSGIQSIVIPYTVNSIGDGAFYACTNLTNARFDINNRPVSQGACECGEQEEEEEPENPEEEESPIEDDTVWSTLETIPSFCFKRVDK